MSRNRVLVDSSFLYALHNLRERNHRKAAHFVKNDRSIRLIPDVTLPETAFLFNRFGGERAVMAFLETLEVARPQLEPITLADLIRARQIIAAYQGAQLDFVDCCIMALTDRLNITQVCTFDRRDFAIFRPKHCEYLELLP